MLAEYDMKITMLVSGADDKALTTATTAFDEMEKKDDFLSTINAAIKKALEAKGLAVIASTGVVFGSNLVFYLATLFVSLISILWL